MQQHKQQERTTILTPTAAKVRATWMTSRFEERATLVASRFEERLQDQTQATWRGLLYCKQDIGSVVEAAQQ